MIRKIAHRLLPTGSTQRTVASRIKRIIVRGNGTPAKQYRKWIKEFEPTTLSPVVKNQTLKISIVVPCYNTPLRYINELIQSIIDQTYQNWQLCIADGSTDEQASRAIADCCKKDSRISYSKSNKNLGISGNTNEAIKQVKGDYVAFLDHDDILAKNALNEIASAINNNPRSNILYSDEDRLSEDGKERETPLFKPDWSLDFFLSVNYVTHLFVIDSILLKKLGGLDKKYDGSQDYDLMLRALEHNPVIVHIPKILYHMRKARTSTAHSMSTKDYAHSAGREALTAYLRRNQIKARVLRVANRPTNHRIHYDLIGSPLVSIIIPFKDKANLLKNCVNSILNKTAYQNYEISLQYRRTGNI